MSSKRNLAYVLTALEAIEKIFIYVRGLESAEAFFEANDQLNFNACQVLLMVIGEETKKITSDLKAHSPHIPWNQIAGMRNRIAHDYRSLNPDISFDVINNHLPALKEALILMVGQIDYPHERLLQVLQSKYYRHLYYLTS